MFVALVPIYIAEVAPPATRGLLVGQHGEYNRIQPRIQDSGH
jgi:hypothetical protein